MNEKPLTQEQARQVYDILRDECGATEEMRWHFVTVQTKAHCPEFRFEGKLGFGGKFYRGNSSLYVSCYSEDITPERAASIEKANAKLRGVLEAFV